jgi:hypothetical protein
LTKPEFFNSHAWLHQLPQEKEQRANWLPTSPVVIYEFRTVLRY